MGKTIIGIDPGLNGAFSIVSVDGVILKLCVAPTLKITKTKRDFDLQEMVALFQEAKRYEPIVWIEKVASRPGQSAPATFNFGKGYGYWKMLAAVFKFPFYEVHPRTWKTRVLPGTDGSKGASILKAKQLFPLTDFLATERSKVPHDGLAEALLIATYGRLYG